MADRRVGPRGSSRRIANTIAFGAFRDAVCVSAVVAGQGLTMKWGSSDRGIIFSDAFDIYPWFPSPELGFEKYVAAVTPALCGLRETRDLRPQSAPALGNRSLSLIHVDRPLLQALLERWEHCFAAGRESDEDRRLFRALEMACAASRIPGGADASEHHFGRAVALWVSAFEILVHDEKWSDTKQVPARPRTATAPGCAARYGETAAGQEIERSDDGPQRAYLHMSVGYPTSAVVIIVA